MADVDRPYVIDESDDGSFLDEEDAVAEGGIDPLDIIDRAKRRRLPKQPEPTDGETYDPFLT